MAKRAVIYARTAIRTGTSPDAIRRQLEQCREFAAGRGWDVIREYSDTASARSPRPGFNTAVQSARRGGYDALVAPSASRLTRDASELASILADADASGFAIVTADGMLDASMELGVMTARMMARFTVRWDEEVHGAPAR